MNRKLKRALSAALALTMVVTSVQVIGLPESAKERVVYGAEAADVDLTGVTAEVDSVQNGSAQIMEALQAEKYTIDGIVYNNYTKYKGLTAAATSEKEASAHSIDGSLGSRWESEQKHDPEDLTIDFGNVYALKEIMIYWEAASAKTYTVEVSADGSAFKPLKEVSINVGKRTDEIKLSKEINVRAVRIHGTSRTTNYGYSIYEIGFFGSEGQKKVTPIMSNLQIRDYYKYTGRYIIYFNEAGESSGYNVYVDSTDTPVKSIKHTGECLTAEELKGFAPGEHTMYLANVVSGKESAKISKKFTISDKAGTFTEIPQIYIYTAKNVTSEYHPDADVTISIFDKDGGIYKPYTDGECNIKIRGNTTAAHPKKPWNIKLSGKQSVLGMDKGKKWCLLANAFDKSLMRNSLAYDMGLENGVTYTCQSRYVDIYINGTYNGNYLMTEPVEAKKERVDIDAYNAKSNDILLELGTRNEPDVDHFTTDVLRTTYDVNDPERGDDLTDEEIYAKIDRVKAYLNEFETTLKGHDYSKILKYIDEDTFVNFYVVSELFKNVDFNFSSTRFYIKDNRIYAGPPWDYDLSSGNCKSSFYTDYYRDGVSWKDYYCQKQNWYRELFKTAEFKERVKKRYAELQYVIQNIYKEDSTETLSINYLVDTYGKSFERNYRAKDGLGAGWILTDDNYGLSSEAGWTSWEQPIAHLRDWMKNRNAWMCEDMGIDMQQAYIDSTPKEPETTTETPTTTAKPTTPAQTTTAPTTQMPTTVPPTTIPSTTVPMTTETTTIDVPTTPDETTEIDGPIETTKPDETSTEEPSADESTTAADSSTDETTATENPATTPKQDVTTTSAKVKIPEKAKIKKVSAKKLASTKAKLSLKKIKGAKGYQVAVYKTKKLAKKNKKALVKKFAKKVKATVTSKKLKNKKTLYVKVRAYIFDEKGKKIYGKWSKIKKIRLKR